VVRARLLAALLAAAGPAAAAGGGAAASCSTALALGLDVSSSVDAFEHRLQTGGLAAAFRDEAVVDAILGGTGTGVMVAVYEWSGFHQQDLMVRWTWLGDRAAIGALADRLDGHVRRLDTWPTSLGRAVEFAVQLHGENPRECTRRIIDISGDGINNHGVGPEWYRERGVLDGFTVNGLAIRGAVPDPVQYYRDKLIHGPGAFVEVADGYDDYARAILRKLLRELQTPIAMGR
jgi:Ca-activated chloride channel homolog